MLFVGECFFPRERHLSLVHDMCSVGHPEQQAGQTECCAAVPQTHAKLLGMAQ